MGIYFLACHRIHTIAAFFKKKKKNKPKKAFLGQVYTKYIHEIFVLENASDFN